MHTVTRQINTYEGTKVVEISQGGIDYCNPGALSKQYPGEFEEFANPVEAVEAAIKIAQLWQKDAPDDEILIDHGATGGYTMFFDGMEQTEETFAELREWAKNLLEQMPKCDQCGEIITGNPITLADYGDDWKFCREYCAETWYSEQLVEEEEDEEE